jgi:hypothetical protein
MFESKRNGASAAALTLGATRERLIALGYTPVSALDPHERMVAQHGPHVVSEHPPAVLCHALVLTPINDQTLSARVRALFEKRGLLAGPVRVGSDGIEMRPVRFSSRWSLNALRDINGLGDSVWLSSDDTVIPLDGLWPQGGLLAVPFAKLPEVSADWAQALFEEIGRLPYRIAEEQRPPPKPSRRAWLGEP